MEGGARNVIFDIDEFDSARPDRVVWINDNINCVAGIRRERTSQPPVSRGEDGGANGKTAVGTECTV